MNTIPPNDFSYYEMLNDVVQQEPATSLDPELMGPLAAIGIVKGKPFAPDARMKKILTEALAVANATSRSLFMNPRDPSWYLLSRLGVDELPVRHRLRVRDADPDGHHARASSPSRPPATARWTRARRSSTASPASRRRWPCACPASARSISSPSLDADKQLLRRRQDLQGDAAQRHSGGELLVVHALRQPDALDARHAAALPARRQPELSVARRRGERRRLDDGLLQPDAARRA